MEHVVDFLPVVGKHADTSMTSVIVVEDDRLLRQSLARLIGEARSYRCLGTFTTAEEALEKVPGLRPDVVVMDINLPKMSGIDCTRQLKLAHPEIGVLMLTVYDDSERIFEALRVGASGYLLKRSVATEILQAIQDVKEGGAPMSSQVARKVVASFRVAAKADAENATLSERETEILAHLSKGYSNKEISERMCISLSTVRTHLRHIYEKLHVRSRAEAIVRFRH
ncbi:MAG: response regulator transcription factor [Verrucomicrobiae bacterium]|nr:response regulator transcription factor [Verrucomicrobiae bacterium]